MTPRCWWCSWPSTKRAREAEAAAAADEHQPPWCPDVEESAQAGSLTLRWLCSACTSGFESGGQRDVGRVISCLLYNGVSARSAAAVATICEESTSCGPGILHVRAPRLMRDHAPRFRVRIPAVPYHMRTLALPGARSVGAVKSSWGVDGYVCTRLFVASRGLWG